MFPTLPLPQSPNLNEPPKWTPSKSLPLMWTLLQNKDFQKRLYFSYDDVYLNMETCHTGSDTQGLLSQ